MIYRFVRLHRELRNQGIHLGRHRVARLMHEDDIKTKIRRRYKATMNSEHDFSVAPNLIKLIFHLKPLTKSGQEILQVSTMGAVHNMPAGISKSC